ncbi:MAG: bifunctional aspartate kinase/diaminopimelate decarboxylase [Xanthomonadales bacterium]|nr:bifunctional aspartate kinase/diaminopimelate decarboxylase [Xanthomonadales bacterium]
MEAGSGAADAPIVLKFGGTSVASAERWRRIAELARRRLDEPAPVLVVVSALAGVTNALLAAVGDRDRRAALRPILERHERLREELGLPASPDWRERVQAALGLADGDAEDPAWQAEWLAQGELLASRIGADHLALALGGCRFLDARTLLRARPFPNQSARAVRLSALCEVEPRPELARELFGEPPLAITQGFVVAHPEGGSALLGRGGSDTSASLLGALLGARRVEIWTDVAGMFSADPREVPEARLLRELDYEEAQEIATTGAKVLHPRCLQPLREAGVPLHVYDTARPELPGTRIGAVAPRPGVKAISARRRVTLVSMETIGMWQQVGFLASVFEIFRRHGLSVDLIGSAETNVTVSLDPTENLLEPGVIEALCADLSAVCRVKVIAPCAAISLVGRGMRSLMHRLSEAMRLVGQRRVHLVSQSSNDLNLTFVVDEADAADLVPRLHELLLRYGLLEDDGAVFGPAWRELYGEASARSRPAPWWREAREALLAEAGRGTPVYVYDLRTLRERARALRALPGLGRVLYAVKANPHPELLAALAEEGIGFECVSVGELARVLEACPGLDPERVLFTPNFARREDYEAALARGVRLTLDDLAPLRQWPELFRGRPLLLRIDVGRGVGHHEKVRTGGAGSKFGIAPSELAEAERLCRGSGAVIEGLHAHLGSGVFDPAHWQEVGAALAALAEALPAARILDLGGGLGVPAREEEPALDLGGLGAALAELRRLYPRHELWLEPGRFLVAEAGVLLARVSQVKRKDGEIFVGIDAGMHTLLRPALYDAFHPVWNLSRLERPPAIRAHVVGPVCESGDVLARHRRLPECAPGDVLLIGVAGAYGAAMASRYNLFPWPREVVR